MKPLLDLNMTEVDPKMRAHQIASLPGGEAVVHHYNDRAMTSEQVDRINQTGRIKQFLYQCSLCSDGDIFYTGCSVISETCRKFQSECESGLYKPVSGLIIVDNKLFVLHHNKRVIKIHLSNETTCDTEDHVTGEIPIIYNKDIFSYSLSTKLTKKRLTDLSQPKVTTATRNKDSFFVVSESQKVRVFNSTWDPIGGFITSGPSTAIIVFVPHPTLFVADYSHDNISMLSLQGQIIRHLLNKSDGINKPLSMSFSVPHLWVLMQDGTLYRYKLYKD